MLLESLDITKNRDKVFGAGEGAGASGSFFFFSHDQRFIIKTLRGNEKFTFLKMIKSYIKHIVDSNNESLIARIYGIYRVKTSFFKSVGKRSFFISRQELEN